MKLNYYMTEDYEELSHQTVEIIIDYINVHPTGLYCFAGGDTPVKALQMLAEAANEKRVDLSKAFFIELDEWVGLDPNDSGSCASYLDRNLFGPAGIRPEQIHTFNALSDDLEGECKEANQFVKEHGGLSLTLLGVGVNGHVGFNEPGVSFEDNAHVMTLDGVTGEVGKKYFQGSENLNLTQGITLGVKQLLASDCLIVHANGERKKEAITKVLQGTVTNECPATVLWNHKDPILIVDKATFR